jgi:hypothetical protein
MEARVQHYLATQLVGYKPPAPETIALNYREITKKEEKKTLIH